ncbi:MAG: type II toxin-antitoxin system RelE/ParE family toxin [Pseudomonadales bacterium]|nr:type II toxin-antitoxin system RelE/ParE family toxin [Pseudomonadales bacterium]
MIKSETKQVRAIRDGYTVQKLPPQIQDRARTLLAQLDSATSIADLKHPPSNRLHKLSGKLKGLRSLSIDKQWRIVFRWDRGDAYEVEITDYH